MTAYRLQNNIVSRIVLNLSQMASPHEDSSCRTVTSMGSLVFATNPNQGSATVSGPVGALQDNLDEKKQRQAGKDEENLHLIDRDNRKVGA